MTKLQTYLSAQKMTQERFSTLADLSQGAVSKLCRTGKPISLEAAIRIEKITNGEVPIESWPSFAALKDMRDTPRKC